MASTPILRGRPHAFVMPMNCPSMSSVSPRDEQGRKSSCRIDAGPHAPDGSPKACHPQSALVAHRGSCWPVLLRRSPHDVAVTCIPWRAPLMAEAPKSLSSQLPCKHGRWDSFDSRLPMGIDSGARSSGPRSPKTRGDDRDSDDGASPRGGAPFVATRCISAGAIRPPTGPLVRVTIHDWRGPRPHRPHDCSRGRPGRRTRFLAAKDPKVSDDGSPSPHLDASRDASVSDICSLPSFDFQRRAPRLVPRSRPDPRGGRVKPRVTTRRPRFGSNMPSLEP